VVRFNVRDSTSINITIITISEDQSVGERRAGRRGKRETERRGLKGFGK
jgi:hypothetical protein